MMTVERPVTAKALSNTCTGMNIHIALVLLLHVLSMYMFHVQ